MGIYTNTDDLLAALGGFSGMKKGTILDAVSHYVQGVNIGANATEAIKETFNTDEKNTNINNDTMIECTKNEKWGSITTFRKVYNNPDSISKFKKDNGYEN